MGLHVAVAGNIGSGKTTLTTLLAKHYKWKAYYEDVTNNPYLADFYDDMHRWSFNLQIFFLSSRLSQIIEIKRSNKPVIQDRTIYEDAYIFAPNLHSMGLMSTRDFETYFSLFKIMISLVSPPDLIIYLQASIAKLVEQIQKRGREYEQSISIEYLKRLNERYEEWASSFNATKLLVINVDNLDFYNRKEDLSGIINLIDANLFGLL
ncbi:MAG: deoxynucleoside kinase [Bacteroidales bacterium]|nr:deoxynucleoside kinase [Bacteroidales bacterium]